MRLHRALCHVSHWGVAYFSPSLSLSFLIIRPQLKHGRGPARTDTERTQNAGRGSIRPRLFFFGLRGGFTLFIVCGCAHDTARLEFMT